MEANLLAVKNAANVERTKNLLCFTSDDGGEDELPLGVINLVEREIVLTGFFGQPCLQSVPKVPSKITNFAKREIFLTGFFR